MEIVLTNDDGIWAIGLRSLYMSLKAAGHRVQVIAPLTEQSAVGHAVTFTAPVRIKEIKSSDFEGIGVFGTPVDCVKLALTEILDSPPDLLISGINSGANVGVDILYSGTVAAATEAALNGVPALSVSIDNFSPEDLSDQSEYVCRFIEKIEWDNYTKKVFNLNFPNLPMSEVKGFKICPQTQVAYKDWYEKRYDPRGKPYFWLCGYIPDKELSPDTDRALLSEGFITLTPLHFDFTDVKLLEELKNINPF